MVATAATTRRDIGYYRALVHEDRTLEHRRTTLRSNPDYQSSFWGRHRWSIRTHPPMFPHGDPLSLDPRGFVDGRLGPVRNQEQDRTLHPCRPWHGRFILLAGELLPHRVTEFARRFPAKGNRDRGSQGTCLHPILMQHASPPQQLKECQVQIQGNQYRGDQKGGHRNPQWGGPKSGTISPIHPTKPFQEMIWSGIRRCFDPRHATNIREHSRLPLDTSQKVSVFPRAGGVAIRAIAQPPAERRF